MLLGLACNIQYGANPELQRILHKTFVDVMLAESQKEGENLNRLTNRAVYLLCWLIRYLPKEILRLIQKFDFTKKNPKLIYINTGETMISLQDSILVTFLNLAGFDILFFVPTGYQSVENYFAEKLMEEHQIGEYKYDMQVPDLNNISTNSTRPSWRRKLFRRG